MTERIVVQPIESSPMPIIPGVWDPGPHQPIKVERAWQELVTQVGGQLVSGLLAQGAGIENADFIFENAKVVIELKEIQTELGQSERFKRDFDRLMNRVMDENPDWRPALLGGNDVSPTWFQSEFVRLFRPSVSRILKKANRQLRETKKYFEIKSATGVLLLVNDGFTQIDPQMVQALAAQLLCTSYSSVDCMVYLTVNRYLEFPDSNTPRLLWAPLYSKRAPDSLVGFIDSLGRQWFNYLEKYIGPFTDREEIATGSGLTSDILRGVKPIILPQGE